MMDFINGSTIVGPKSRGGYTSSAAIVTVARMLRGGYLSAGRATSQHSSRVQVRHHGGTGALMNKQ